MSQFHGVRTRTAHKHRWGSTPIGSGCVPVTRTGVKANKYFYIREIRCQAEPGSFGTALVRSDERENGCQPRNSFVETGLAPSPLAGIAPAANGAAESRVSTLLFLQVVDFPLQPRVPADQGGQIPNVNNPGGGVGG